MELITFVSFVLAVLVTAAIVYAAQSKYVNHIEAAVTKASAYLDANKEYFIEQYSDATYEHAHALINEAMQALDDKHITIAETIALLQAAYPIAKDVLKLFAQRILE